MTSEQLAAEIARSSGRAMIGFKDPSAARGVDATGRTLAADTSAAIGKQFARSLGAEILYEFKKLPALVVKVAATAAIVDSLRGSPYVDYVEPDALGNVSSQTTTWNVSRIQGTVAWSYSTGSGVKLLIIDTGVGGHEDLSVPVAYNCIQGGSTSDVKGHGTAVAGVAAALNNSIDVVGASYGVTLWSANAWDPNAHQQQGAITSAQVACAIDVARVNGVKVVNMSFHVDTTATLTATIQGGYNYDDILFVAAAGNNVPGDSSIDYPASLAEVIAVAATMYDNTRAPYSSVGSKIELSAPGDSTGYDGLLTTALSGASVCPALPGLAVGKCDGTSMASPHVAAAAALLRAYDASLHNTDVRTRLDCAAYYLGDSRWYGNGLVQAKSAITGVC